MTEDTQSEDFKMEVHSMQPGSFDYNFDHSKLKPTLSDFKEVGKNPNSKFPYKFMIFKGNNSNVVESVVKCRGFIRVLIIICRFQKMKKILLPILIFCGNQHNSILR